MPQESQPQCHPHTPKGKGGGLGRMTPAGPSGSRGSIRCPCYRRPFGPYKRKCKSIVRSRGRKWPFTPENPPVFHTGWKPAPRCPLRRQAASTRSACSPRDGPERSFKAATRVRIPLGSPHLVYFPPTLPGRGAGEHLIYPANTLGLSKPFSYKYFKYLATPAHSGFRGLSSSCSDYTDPIDPREN